MNVKIVLKYGLLAFLAVAVVVIAGKEMQRSAVKETEAESTTEALPQDGLVVYYFHSNIRCATCQKIESNAEEAIVSQFADELASGALSWRVVNYEAPENAHFVLEYEIAAPTVVLVRREAGQNFQWRNLSRVWELVGDKSAFADYVVQEADVLLSVN